MQKDHGPRCQGVEEPAGGMELAGNKTGTCSASPDWQKWLAFSKQAGSGGGLPGLCSQASRLNSWDADLTQAQLSNFEP